MGFQVLTASGAVKTGTTPTADMAAATGTLTVAHGGTSVATLTAHGVLVGEGAGAVVATAAGTTGQVLTGVTGADPVWAAPAAISALVLLEQHTASASASLVFTTGITATYDSYEFDLINILPANAAVDLRVKVSTDGGGSYVAGNEYYGAVRIEPNSGSTGLTQVGAAAAALVFPAVDNTVLRGGVSGKIQMFNPLSATISKSFTMQLYGSRAADVTSGTGFMLWFNATAVNAIQFTFSAGNIASGTIRLYGVAK